MTDWHRKWNNNQHKNNTETRTLISLYICSTFFAVPFHTLLLFLLQSALQPLWVLACSTIAEYSQQEDFTECRCQRHVKLHVWNDASEPQQRKVELWARNGREFCRKWRLPRHFWVLLHAVNYDMGPTALLPLRRKARWGFFRPKNPTASAGFEHANLGTRGQHAYL